MSDAPKFDNTPVGRFPRLNFDHPDMIKGITKIMKPPKIIEYQYVSGVWDQIDQMVNLLIAEGWQPLGGTSLAWDPHDERYWYCQGMVKYDI